MDNDLTLAGVLNWVLVVVVVVLGGLVLVFGDGLIEADALDVNLVDILVDILVDVGVRGASSTVFGPGLG